MLEKNNSVVINGHAEKVGLIDILWPAVACMLLMSTAFFLVPVANKNAIGDPDFVRRTLFALFFNFAWCVVLPYGLLLASGVVLRLLACAVASVGVAFSVFSVLHLLLYGQLIGAPSVSALLDTNYSEASEFVLFSATPRNIILFSLALAYALFLGVLMCKKLFHIKNFGVKRRYPIIGILILGGLTVFGWHRTSFALNNPFVFIAKTGEEVYENRSEYKKMENQRPEISNAKYLGDDQDHKIHIIVIGESATPSHMSVYGYQRVTDPFVRNYTGAMRLFRARDVCASKPNTHLSMFDIMLSERGARFGQEGPAPANLISILKDAGFHVQWLSNQPGGAGFFSLASTWGGHADESFFLNKRDFREGYDFDEIVIPALTKTLKNSAKKKVIFVHLMGSHPDYKQRYPSKFKIWGSTAEAPDGISRKSFGDFDLEKFNAYDNSIAYTDSILSEIIGLAVAFSADSVTYFSDHGQNLGEITPIVGHSVDSGPRQGFEVPLFFWINESLDPKSSENLRVFEKNLQKPYSLDRIQYSLFDLFHISYPEQSANQSLFSDQYSLTTRACDKFH